MDDERGPKQAARPVNRLASHLCWLFAIFLIFGGSPMLMAERAHDTVLPPAPPQPVPQVIKVHRGAKADIDLRIYGSQKAELHFPIRTKPTAGKLSEPVAKGREAAVVTYEPPADLAVTHDRFTYASQGAAGVSAPAEVRIEIIDDPADLEVPKALDFSPMLSGGKATREFEISNRGGSVAEGQIEVEAPWSIDGSRKYRLTAGARQSFRLIFAPVRDGGFESDLRYTSQPERSTAVTGRANAALSLSTARLELRSQPGDAARSAAFELSNNTENDQTVTLSASARLHMPSSVAVPAKGHLSIPVEASGSDPAALQDELHVNGAGIELRLPVLAAASPAVLRTTSELIQFPPGKAGQTLAVPIEVANIGGNSGSWKWEITPPFEVPEAEGTLASGEKRTLAVRLHSTEAGHFRTWLKIRGEQQSLEIPVDAVVSPLTATLPSPNRRQSSAGDIRRVSVSSDEASGEREAPRGGGIAVVRTDVTVSDIGPSSATISWPWTPSDPMKYRVEERFLSLDQNHELKIDWIEHRLLKVQVVGNKVVVDLQGLRPGMLHAFRFSPMAGDGSVGAPIFMTQFSTLPKLNPFRITATRAWILAGLFLAGFLFWRFRYRR